MRSISSKRRSMSASFWPRGLLMGDALRGGGPRDETGLGLGGFGGFGGFCLGVVAVTTLEFFDAPGGVNQLLFARVEGVALGADFDVDFALGGVGGEGFAATAGYFALDVFWVKAVFHSVRLPAGHKNSCSLRTENVP